MPNSTGLVQGFYSKDIIVVQEASDCYSLPRPVEYLEYKYLKNSDLITA